MQLDLYLRVLQVFLHQVSYCARDRFGKSLSPQTNNHRRITSFTCLLCALSPKTIESSVFPVLVVCRKELGAMTKEKWGYRRPCGWFTCCFVNSRHSLGLRYPSNWMTIATAMSNRPMSKAWYTKSCKNSSGTGILIDPGSHFRQPDKHNFEETKKSCLATLHLISCKPYTK